MPNIDTTLALVEKHAKTMSRQHLEQEYTKLQRAALQREVDDIERRQAAAEAAQRAATEKAEAERKEAQAENLEAMRRAVWLNHINENAIAANKDVLWADVVERAKRETPASGWPPGKSEADYYLSPTDEEMSPASDVASTFLGKLAAAKT